MRHQFDAVCLRALKWSGKWFLNASGQTDCRKQQQKLHNSVSCSFFFCVINLNHILNLAWAFSQICLHFTFPVFPVFRRITFHGRLLGAAFDFRVPYFSDLFFSACSLENARPARWNDAIKWKWHSLNIYFRIPMRWGTSLLNSAKFSSMKWDFKLNRRQTNKILGLAPLLAKTNPRTVPRAGSKSKSPCGKINSLQFMTVQLSPGMPGEYRCGSGHFADWKVGVAQRTCRDTKLAWKD